MTKTTKYKRWTDKGCEHIEAIKKFLLKREVILGSYEDIIFTCNKCKAREYY